MAFISIFNDVLGPVMRGPSSSHTAGAYRIGRLVRSLSSGKMTRIRCSFDPEGSYAPTYKPSGVDLAFTAGVMGWDMADRRYFDALPIAARSGVEIEFDVSTLAYADHPNTIRIAVETTPENSSGEVASDAAATAPFTVWARSTGGGAIELYRLDEWNLHLDGKSWVLLAVCQESSADTLLAHMERLSCSDRSDRGALIDRQTAFGKTLLHWQSDSPADEDAVAGLGRASGLSSLHLVPPVFYTRAGPELFSSATELLEAAVREGLTLGQTAMNYEGTLLGLSPEQLTQEMLARYAVMRSSVDSGFQDEAVAMPLTRPTAARIRKAQQDGRLPTGGVQTRAAVRAMACMHTCNSKGVVCAAPTGGSAGVIPGVLTTLEEERDLNPDAVVRALFAASAVGLIVAKRATFAAEIAGCQVEIGAAGAMAAALVVETAGGGPSQALDAAAIALQNTMGSICDPVGGGCEIPCHTRNAAAASNAFLCADLIIGGHHNPIGLDETIDASLAVGRSLPRELRCTALGGIAVAPSAQALAKHTPL